jgi:AcrR family transcriptional regulator
VATTTGGSRTAEAIRQAAIRLFYEQGYEATTLREIATAVGVQVGSLYNHITSKEELLDAIVRRVAIDLAAALDSALAGVTDPVERLRAVVACHVVFHAERWRELYISDTELRSLSPAKRAEVEAMRRTHEARVVAILDDGTRAGAFVGGDSTLLARAVIAVAAQVASWYTPDLDVDLVRTAALYADTVLHGVVRTVVATA